MGRAYLETRSEVVGALADGRAAGLRSGSRMSGDVQVRFCERLGVRFPGPTHLVLGFQHRKEAERCLGQLRERMADYGLELHSEKTRLIQFGRFAAEDRKRDGAGKPETFDFLGFTHICGTTWKNGKFTVKRKTVGKRMRS